MPSANDPDLVLKSNREAASSGPPLSDSCSQSWWASPAPDSNLLHLAPLTAPRLKRRGCWFSFLTPQAPIWFFFSPCPPVFRIPPLIPNQGFGEGGAGVYPSSLEAGIHPGGQFITGHTHTDTHKPRAYLILCLIFEFACVALTTARFYCRRWWLSLLLPTDRGQ